ncbi:MAG: DUF393 domain-containing protein [Verrucomicrobiales bacterium]|nr:DUF393 domain-containing protein [Verrucomicrobiales bacterium]
MSAASPGNASPILLFDGVCNLCHGFVRWVLAWDRRNTFRFASLQSVAARSALESAGVSPGSLPDSVVLLLPGEPPRVKSDAVLAVARILGFPWSLAGVGRVLPRTFRDRLYDWVAVHRYRWFGRRDTCLVPTTALRGRFLDADEIPKSP